MNVGAALENWLFSLVHQPSVVGEHISSLGYRVFSLVKHVLGLVNDTIYLDNSHLSLMQLCLFLENRFSFSLELQNFAVGCDFASLRKELLFYLREILG